MKAKPKTIGEIIGNITVLEFPWAVSAICWVGVAIVVLLSVLT